MPCPSLPRRNRHMPCHTPQQLPLQWPSQPCKPAPAATTAAAGPSASGLQASPEPAGAPAHVVLHDLRLHHLPKLGKVVLELVCRWGAGTWRRNMAGEEGRERDERGRTHAAGRPGNATGSCRPPCQRRAGSSATAAAVAMPHVMDQQDELALLPPCQCPPSRQGSAARTVGGLGAQPAHKHLARLGLELLGHRLLGVNLCRRGGGQRSCRGQVSGWAAGTERARQAVRTRVPPSYLRGYAFRPAAVWPSPPLLPHPGAPPEQHRAAADGTHLAAIDDVHVQHHRVRRRRRREGYKAKAAGPARLAVAHHDLRG